MHGSNLKPLMTLLTRRQAIYVYLLCSAADRAFGPSHAPVSACGKALATNIRSRVRAHKAGNFVLAYLLIQLPLIIAQPVRFC